MEQCAGQARVVEGSGVQPAPPTPPAPVRLHYALARIRHRPASEIIIVIPRNREESFHHTPLTEQV
jgi:hypothetical protein